MTKTIASVLTLSLAFAAGVIIGAFNSKPRIEKIAALSKSAQPIESKMAPQMKLTKVSPLNTQKISIKENVKKNKFLNKKRRGYTVLLSSFKVEENANSYAHKINKKGYDAFYFSKSIKGKVWHRVGVGSFSSKSTAESLKKQLTENRLGKGSLITKIPKAGSF